MHPELLVIIPICVGIVGAMALSLVAPPERPSEQVPPRNTDAILRCMPLVQFGCGLLVRAGEAAYAFLLTSTFLNRLPCCSCNASAFCWCSRDRRPSEDSRWLLHVSSKSS